MKKILILCIIIGLMFSFLNGKNLHEYSVQEILNLIYKDYSGNMHEYSDQEVLNLVYSTSDSALKVTITGLSSDSSYIDTLVFNLGYGDSLSVDFLGSNDSTEIELLDDLFINSFETSTNAGAITILNAPVDTNSADGTEESYSFAIDNTTVWKIGALSDGAGGVDSEFATINGWIEVDSLTADPPSKPSGKALIWYGGGDDSLHIWTGAGKQTFQLKAAD